MPVEKLFCVFFFQHDVNTLSGQSVIINNMILAPCIYAGRFGLTAWRKKSSILLAILLLALIILGVHYNIGYGVSSSEIGPKDAVMSEDQNLGGEPVAVLGESKKKYNPKTDGLVHFVKSFESKNYDQKEVRQTDPAMVVFSEKELLQNLDQSLKEELAAKRRDNIGLVVESVNQDNQDSYANQQTIMGIPFANIDAKNPYIPPKRIVHLDLKGAPPKVSYILRLFPILKTLGATGILVEYEDMFPFHGTLADITATNAYSKEQIREILQGAKENDLEVIPLVQTFGHLEFALKRESFAHLREVPESPQALCPSLNQSLDFIEAMINQVIEFHPNIRQLHIGCDEVFQMGECSRCRKTMSELTGPAAGTRDALFLYHIKSVTRILSKNHPSVRPIVWDDMLRHIPMRDMLDADLGAKVDPMVWVYAEDVYRFVPTHIWDKYAMVFSTVWTASAYKGAFGETEYVPNARRHLENNLRWLELMNQETSKFKNGFAGIALTGWQRYDHFAVLCELLPSAIPSLAISLITVSRGRFDPEAADLVGGTLGCPTSGGRPSQQPALSLNTDPHMWDRFGRCLFPGNAFFKLTYRLHVAEMEAKEYIEQTTRLKGWMTPYNVKHNYSAPLRITELTGDLSRLLRSLSTLARSASEALADVVDHYTIAEWVEQRVYPDIIALEKIQGDAQALSNRKVWDRRPLNPIEDLKRFGLVTPNSERH